MVEFIRHTLANGLRVIIHEDPNTPMASVCVTYNVGTKFEQSDKTGYAHLLEHIMFCGTSAVPNFDEVVQQAGGENNAFTNQDMTVYYQHVPAQNVEMALYLEADRMQDLAFDSSKFDREKRVVVEEFKECCLNEPYGDIWHHLGPLAYGEHPYSIPTIGSQLEHVADATVEDLKAFYSTFYTPSNAVLSIAGNVQAQQVIKWVEKWFSEVQDQVVPTTTRPSVEMMKKASLEVKADVPLRSIYMAFNSSDRMNRAYYLDDIISDILADGEDAPFYKELVKEQEIFTDLEAYITASIDGGLFVIEGRLTDENDFETGLNAIWQLLDRFCDDLVPERTMHKIQNRIEHNVIVSELSNMHKAMSLGYYETLGNASMINNERDIYLSIKVDEIQERARFMFDRSKCCVIYYDTID